MKTHLTNSQTAPSIKPLSLTRHAHGLALAVVLSAAATSASFGQNHTVISPGTQATASIVTIGSGFTLTISPTASLKVIESTFLSDGGIIINEGDFITGGLVDGDDSSILTFQGVGLFTSENATFVLEDTKTFDIAGTLDITTGVTFDLTGLALPDYNGSVQTGDLLLGLDGAIIGEFDLATTSILGLSDPAGATFISEAAGEGMTFDPLTESVYWVAEDAGLVSLNYSIAPVPEPASAVLLLGGAALLTLRRRGIARI